MLLVHDTSSTQQQRIDYSIMTMETLKKYTELSLPGYFCVMMIGQYMLFHFFSLNQQTSELVSA